MERTTELLSLWEDGWLDPSVESFMWMQMARAYAVDRVMFAPSHPGIRGAIQQYETVEAAIASSGCHVVFLEPWEGDSLDDFKHPVNALYVFGNAKQSNVNRHRPGDSVVVIPTPNAIDMFATQAAAIVLDHRRRVFE